MEFTCNTKRLLAAVTACCRVAKRQNFKPVLECLRITANNDVVSVFATDLERTVSLDIPADVVESGTCIIHGQRFRAALSQESGETVCLSADESRIVLKDDTSEIQFGAQEDTLPTITIPKGEETLSLPCCAMVAGIRSTVWAADEESSRYCLGGVFIDCGLTESYMVGTNGRVGAAYGPLAAAAKECSAIVPIGSCMALTSILPDDGDCSILISNNDTAFRFEGGYFVARLLEGRFPQWRQIFPVNQRIHVDIAAGAMAGLVAKCLLVRREGDEKQKIDHQVTSSFAFGDGLLVATAESDLGKSSAQTIINQCESVTVYLDSGYAADLLRVVNPSEIISIGIIDPASAVLFTQGNLRCVIMPLDPSR